MPEGIKFNSTSVETKSLRSGNIYFGIGDDPKGPTTLTGFKSAVDFGTSISLIALHRGDGVFSWYKAFTEQDIITFTNKIDLTGINLITNNPTPTTNTTGYAVVGGQGTLTFDSEQSAIRWIRTSYESWGAYVWNNSIQNYLFDKFSNYTITFEWKFGPSHTANQSYNFEIINGPGTYTILGNIGLTANSTLQESGWYRFTRTHTPLQDGVGQTIQYRIIRSTTVETTDIYWRKLEYFKTTRTTKEQCYNYFAGQSDKIIFNKDYDPIITDGLVLNLDAGFLPSYPGTGSSWYDLGSGQSNGTLQNGPIFNSGGWINFDGSNDRCSIPNQTFNSTSNSSFTIEIIFKRNSSTPSSSTQLYRIGTGVSSTNARIFFWFDDNNNGLMSLNYYFSGGVDRYITLSNQLLDTNFHHSVQVIDKTNLEMVGYFDGINKGKGSILSSSTSDTNFLIGNSSGSVNASVALLRIYNRVLSQSEILQNYYQGPIVTDGLVFSFDSSNIVSYPFTGTTAYSLTGSNTLTLANGVGFDKKYGGRWTFDGSNDRLDSNFTDIIDSVTIECWYRGTKTTRNHLWNFGVYPTTNFHCNFNDSGIPLWFYWNGNGTPRLWFTQGNFTDGTIKQLVFTHQGSDNQAYLNGQLLTAGRATSGTQTFNNVNSGGTFNLGGNPSFGGDIYQVRIYNRALSASEIFQNFNAHRSRYGI